MLLLLIEQVAVLVVATLLLGVPGVALVSLFRLREAIPDALAVPAAAVFGALVACAATALQLLVEAPARVPIAVHVGMSVALAAAALVVRRRRRAAGTRVVPVAVGWDRWTSGIVIAAVLFAWIVRGAIRLDGLYHVSLTRKLIELDHPNFDNINRFADGGPNPTYALPGWHAFVGWCSEIVHVDPIIAWEIMPVLVVALGALAAGGLARVLLETARAQPLGALAWVMMRVLYARREVDGDAILYGAVPGQVTFELVFPVLFAVIAVAMWTAQRRVLRACLTTAFACIASIIIYHANYIPYVAIVGLGYAFWWLVNGPFTEHAGRRLLVVGAWIAAMCVACFAAVFPMLSGIDDFGETDETRIDYHLTEIFGMTHIRGGHAYEMLGMPGLLAILVAPIVIWKWRSRHLGVASGGMLALMTMCFIPPLFELLRGTGSLTLGLRINHVIGVFLAVLLAGAILLASDQVASREWSHRRRQLWGAIALLVFVAVGVVIGYNRFAPDLPGYAAWLAIVGIFVVRAVARLRTGRAPTQGETGSPPRTAAGGLVIAVAALVVVGLALPVGAISARRAVVNRDPFTARTHQGDLTCLGGPVERALRNLPAGSMVLSDPASSFRAMALAPVYVVGDYKVWNGTNQADISRRLASVNGFFDTSVDDETRIEQLRDEQVDYLLLNIGDGRWLDRHHAQTATTQTLESVTAALDRFADVQSYDGGAVARIIGRHPEVFHEVVVDPRAREVAIPSAYPGDAAPCNGFGIWKIAR